MNTIIIMYMFTGWGHAQPIAHYDNLTLCKGAAALIEVQAEKRLTKEIKIVCLEISGYSELPK